MTNEKDTQLNVRFLPKGVQNPRFEQRESGIAHTPYSREVAFYTCIKTGICKGLKAIWRILLEMRWLWDE